MTRSKIQYILFKKKIERSMQFVDGNYQMGLPFHDGVMLPDNHSQALQRLCSLKKKMQKLPEFKKNYTEFMNNVLNKTYQEPVPSHELNRADVKVWYIPNNAVYHPHKPGNIRVVFDCASTYKSVAGRSRFDKQSAACFN